MTCCTDRSGSAALFLCVDYCTHGNSVHHNHRKPFINKSVAWSTPLAASIDGGAGRCKLYTAIGHFFVRNTLVYVYVFGALT